MWQMGFMADPRVLKDLEHQLKVDERVLRHMVFRFSGQALATL